MSLSRQLVKVIEKTGTHFKPNTADAKESDKKDILYVPYGFLIEVEKIVTASEDHYLITTVESIGGYNQQRYKFWYVFKKHIELH